MGKCLLFEGKNAPGTTWGSFQLKGQVSGVEKDSFFKEGKAKSGKKNPYRFLNFGVQVSKDSMLFVNLPGYTQEEVTFSKTIEKEKNGKKEKTYKNETIAWDKRNDFKREGFNLSFGVKVRLVSKTEQPKVFNMTGFDACQYLNENLKDGMTVRVLGSIEFGHYTNKQGDIVDTQKLVPTQIYLSQEDDFDAEDFEPTATFEQEVVYQGSERSETKGVYDLRASIVNYRTIEDHTFRIEREGLAKNLKKKLKPGNKIKVYGRINTTSVVEVVEEEAKDDEDWGDENPNKRVFTPYGQVFLVTGADRESLDTESYTLQQIETAIGKMNKDEKAVEEFDEEEDWSDGDDDKDGDDVWDEDSDWDD